MIRNRLLMASERGFGFVFCAGCAALTLGIGGSLLVALLVGSFPIFRVEGWSFLFGRDWFPGEIYGALPMLYGSAVVTTVALLLAIPLALGSALFTAEFLSVGWRRVVKSIMELLASVPGVVYGLLGMTLLAVEVRDWFGLIDGNTLLTASLLLAVMILPTIMTLSEDALRAVPGEYRETALALGLTRAETVLRVVLPQAAGGIIGATLLGMGRAMGETIAVMLVIGGIDRIPQPWYNLFAPGQNIPSKLGREAAETLGIGLHWNALMGLGLVLFVAVQMITLGGQWLTRRSRS